MTSYIEDIIKAFEELAGVKLHDHVKSALDAAIRGNATIQNNSARAMELSALENAGVDNWEGYDYAQEILREWKSEDAPSDEGSNEED